MEKEKNYNILKEYAFKNDINLFGVGDIQTLKEKSFSLDIKGHKDINYAVSMAIRLSDWILDEIKDRPTKLYFHHYRQANNLLDQIAFKIANFIQEQGFQAIPIPSSQIIDWDKQQGHISHKHIAVLAGLGWLGRNNLLINPKYGARLRLISILTDMPLKIDEPVPNGCGSCRACISVCPAKAIKEDQKDFDHMACFEKLREFRNKGYVGQYICGICVRACKKKHNCAN